MSIEAFIQEDVLAKRLEEHGVVVVYDAEQRYRNTCLAMADQQFNVVDTSDGSIESREQALRDLQAVGSRQLHGLLVYVPVAQPLEDEARQRDPFSIYAACGAVFPDRHKDGDDFQSICLLAKPDQATKIREIFARDSQPAFAVIDAVGGGLGWPNLRALLKVESSRDILLALLAPNDLQQAALKDNGAWVSEARDLLNTSIGLSLRTRGKSWSSIADELWRYVLFSEFVFDLPEVLPDALTDMPRAGESARPIIEGLCDSLRNDRRTQSLYIDRAEEIEKALALPEQCRALTDLGVRDTFSFEERTFLQQAMTAYETGDIDRVRAILARHEHSVWTGKGESRAQWYLVDAANKLTVCCDDLDRQLRGNDGSMEALITFYVGALHEVDRLHREFEQGVSDFGWQDMTGVMTPLINKARQRYMRLMEKVQQRFTRHVAQTGWPVNGYLANTQIFDQYVAPKLQQNGHKVAYFMVDALRYELGVALEKQLAEDGAVELHAAMAQLPSITPVGMASLLPGAGQQLSLQKTEQGVTPLFGDKPITTVAQRMEVFRRHYGQRFAEVRLEDFVRGRASVADDTDLLVVRSVEIDSYFEKHPDTAPTEIINALKRIRMAIYQLAEKDFQEVVIATDHGFYMNTHAGPGDRIDKPHGDWLMVHDRCALGDGSADDHHMVTSADKVGISGDFARFSAPLSLAAYRAGLLYFHGGVSLQECVVPVVTMQIKSADQPSVTQATVVIAYKNGAKRITTRVPVIDVSVDASDLFASGVEILLEAQDVDGTVVGEAKAGGVVNAATGTVTLQAGEKAQVALKMQMEFEGKFQVKALDPRTNAIFCQLALQTDYTV